MSLLDDARRVLGGNVSVHLVHDPEQGATYKCLHCPTRRLFGSDDPFVHTSACPTRSLPGIVAALEAIALLARDENWSHGEWMGPGATGDIARYALGLPIEDWSRDAIISALERQGYDPEPCIRHLLDVEAAHE